MHPVMLFGLAEIHRREVLEQATRRQDALRRVSARVTSRTRADVPRHQAP